MEMPVPFLSLQVLLRVKESEIQYLKQEISSLKDELQTALRVMLGAGAVTVAVHVLPALYSGGWLSAVVAYLFRSHVII